MTPIELSNLYEQFRERVSVHVSNGCKRISVLLPDAFCDELHFYRLVFWGYALVQEAAKVPLAFLIRLPPRRSNAQLPKALSRLRTYVSHNLNFEKKRDKSTYMFVHGWFREACGSGTPDGPSQYGMCCNVLAEELRCVLSDAIVACDLLDDPTDGSRLVSDLRSRVQLRWEGYRFDPVVKKCALRLGSPSLDLRRFRAKHLDKWRRTLVEAQEGEQMRALELRIEEELLTVIGRALPVTANEALKQLGLAGRDATVAALLVLRSVRQCGQRTVPELIEYVMSVATESVPDGGIKQG